MPSLGPSAGDGRAGLARHLIQRPRTARPCSARVGAMVVVEQLALPLRRSVTADFASFVVGDNALALAAVRAWAAGDGEPFLALHGAAASGKTHLLRAACQALAVAGKPALALSLRQSALAPAVLDELETLAAVALDDVQQVVGLADWERALFNLFNALQASRRRLLITARAPPATLGWKLADLRSRLASGASFRLEPLTDAGLDWFLRQGAEQRGYALDLAARRYLLSRCGRDPVTLGALLDEIDAAALAQGRAVTVPFLGQLLGQLLSAREACGRMASG